MTTTIEMGPRTFYFRKSFDFDQPAAGGELQLQYLVDDGAVFYLNGKEIHRVNMKDRGSIRYTTRALSSVRDAELSGPIQLSGKNLKQGKNVLAVRCTSTPPTTATSRSGPVSVPRSRACLMASSSTS